MSEHTPGPWKVLNVRLFPEREDAYDDPDSDGRVPVVWIEGAPDHDGSSPIVARVLEHPPQAANARLIAAAPDLLAALKRLVEVGCCAGEGVIEAEAAIAKAEGRR